MNRSDRASGSVRAEDYYYFFLPKKEQKGVDRGGVFVFGELAVFQKKIASKNAVSNADRILHRSFFFQLRLFVFFFLPSGVENRK